MLEGSRLVLKLVEMIDEINSMLPMGTFVTLGSLDSLAFAPGYSKYPQCTVGTLSTLAHGYSGYNKDLHLH